MNLETAIETAFDTLSSAGGRIMDALDEMLTQVWG
jgi:hypothetical protein